MNVDAQAALFALKTVAAMTIAYYVSLRIGFTQPVWALTTVIFVSHPMAGQVLSKAFYRMLGTLLGGTAAVLLVPAFVNEPLALSLALALWLGFCVYLSLLDRTPRSYVFLLAGYTASIIGFPSVTAPDGIFNVAVLRVQEISIGIIAASVVHGVILPRTLTSKIREQTIRTVTTIEQLSCRALAGSRDATLAEERRRLAGSITAIEQLAYHLAFDTERLLPQSAAVRSLEDRAFWLLPLSGAIEDRIAECVAIGAGLAPQVAVLIRRIKQWLAEGIAGPARDDIARELLLEIKRIETTLEAVVAWGWAEMLTVSLLERLSELVLDHRILRELRDHIVSGRLRDLSPEALRLVRSATKRSLQRDHALALRASLGSVAAVATICGFWIATAWPSGSIAALIAGVSVSLFASLPFPGIGIRRFFKGFLFSLPVAALYAFFILPRVTDFAMLIATMAPFLLLCVSLLARPALAPVALGVLVGYVNTVGFTSAYHDSFGTFVNTAVAETLGAAASVTFIDLFQVVGAELAFTRLFRAAFRDIALRAEGRAHDTARWASRMFDRMSLAAARAGPTGIHPAFPPYDTLMGMRIGYLLGELSVFCASLGEGETRETIEATLRNSSAHYRHIKPEARVPLGAMVLDSIDRAVTGCLRDPIPERRRRGVILLTGLRRSLFPEAPVFGSASP